MSKNFSVNFPCASLIWIHFKRVLKIENGFGDCKNVIRRCSKLIIALCDMLCDRKTRNRDTVLRPTEGLVCICYGWVYWIDNYGLFVKGQV